MDMLLLLTIGMPLFGALTLGPISTWGRSAVRTYSLVITLITLALATVLLVNYPADDSLIGFAVSRFPWLSATATSPLDIQLSLGLDGLGVWMFGLSALLMVTSVLVSWEAIEDRAGLFYGMLLLLEFGCLGVFAARDLILFYVFFEFTLIPLFFLIGIWGSEDRRYAAIKFFLFTLAGSVVTFLGLLSIVYWDYQASGANALRFSIDTLTNSLREHPMSETMQIVVFLALFLGFAIKVPLFPFHTWLPLAHVQAPTAGSVVLAGVLLKIGTYGFLRFSIPMLPDGAVACTPFIVGLSAAGIVYGALVSLAQTDMKRLIAYSSVSHLGFCVLGIFALNKIGTQGGTLQMINHGLSTGGLFALVGMLYERYHTREIRQLGGLARKIPRFAFFLVLFTMSSIGLPGLNGFVGEFMVLIGAFQRAWTNSPESWRDLLRFASVLSVSGVVLGAWYMLWLVQRVLFGPLKEPADEGHAHTHSVNDLGLREVAALLPLAVFVVWIGVQPKFFLDRMGPSVDSAITATEHSIEKRFQLQERTAAAETTRDGSI